MLTLFERLKERWISEGVPVCPGVSLEESHAFESQYRVVFPTDLKDYFTTVNGMERWWSDHDLFEFLQLGAVKSVPEELAEFRGIPNYGNVVNALPHPERYFVLADFLICSHVYAIRLSNDASQETPLVGICGDRFWNAAESFTEFGEKYLRSGVGELL
jgi:hypothetical protein